VWDNVTALTLASRLLVLATLVFALFIGFRQMAEDWLPFRTVEILGAGKVHTRQAAPAIVERLHGGFLSLDLDAARLAFETLPWVRDASVRRVWPDRLVVTLREHVPAAAWNDLAVLNVHGEVFPVQPWAGLPRVHAREGSEQEVARRYGEFAGLLGQTWRIDSIRVDARNAWQLEFANGLKLDLGQESQSERLRRFALFYPHAAAQLGRAARVDMRYPNGFAVSLGGNAT
jgi:cell division protein FtsQ